MARAMVLGAGYVGLATAIGLAVRGHQVEVIETRPDRLEPLHQYMQRGSWALAGLSEREAYHYPWILHESSPALIQPLFQVSPGQGAPAPESKYLGFLIAELSRPSLQQEYLPALVKRYFGVRDGADFVVAIRAAGAPNEVVYQSNAALGLAPPKRTPL